MHVIDFLTFFTISELIYTRVFLALAIAFYQSVLIVIIYLRLSVRNALLIYN